MINSISSSSAAMSMLRTSSMQRQPPPQGKDAFKASDTDGDGLVSKTELSTLAAGIEEVTGNTINVDDSITTYDADLDGSLNGEELLGMLNALGFSAPEMPDNAADAMSSSSDGSAANKPPPPPPPSSSEAISAYSQNSGDDLMSQLLAYLQQEDGTASQSFTPIDVVS